MKSASHAFRSRGDVITSAAASKTTYQLPWLPVTDASLPSLTCLIQSSGYLWPQKLLWAGYANRLCGTFGPFFILLPADWSRVDWSTGQSWVTVSGTGSAFWVDFETDEPHSLSFTWSNTFVTSLSLKQRLFAPLALATSLIPTTEVWLSWM